jgi:type IV pilus assembly protein PilC
MNIYKYTAKDEAGKNLKGKVEARDEKQAIDILRARKLVIVALQATSQGSMFSNFSQRVSGDDIVQFTQQLSTMLNSGLPLTDALEMLRMQSRAVMSKVLGDIQSDVQGGMSLAEAMGRHKEVFSGVYVALVRAGEASGKLDEILSRLAENEEKQREFRAKVKGAMIYPIIIFIAMFLVMLVIMIFVVPQLTSIYDSFDAELPFATQILIGISNLVRNWWWVLIGAAAGATIFFRQWHRTPDGKKQIDAMVLRIPVFGTLRVQIIMAEFARTLSLLVKAGISILDALSIVSETVGNSIYREAITLVSKGVEKGMPLAAMLAQQQTFPPLMSQMVAVGEETGQLDEVLGKVARYFEQIAENKIKNLTTAIEPIIMIILGLMVAFIVFAIITPLYKITELF